MKQSILNSKKLILFSKNLFKLIWTQNIDKNLKI